MRSCPDDIKIRVEHSSSLVTHPHFSPCSISLDCVQRRAVRSFFSATENSSSSKHSAGCESFDRRYFACSPKSNWPVWIDWQVLHCWTTDERMCEENVNRKSREIFLSATRSTGHNRPWSSLIHFTRASRSTRSTNKTFFFRQTLSAIYQQCQSHVRRRLSDFFPLLLFWLFSLRLEYTHTQSLNGDHGSWQRFMKVSNIVFFSFAWSVRQITASDYIVCIVCAIPPQNDDDDIDN